MNAHVAVKFIHVLLFRGTDAMHDQSWGARVKWAAICAVLWILSWIIAEGIPIFNDVLGLAVSAVEHHAGFSVLANLSNRAPCLPAGSLSVSRPCSGFI